jgi:hypothetical protein
MEGHEIGWACGTYEKNRNAYRVLVVGPDGDNCKDQGVGGNIILKLMLSK